MKGKKTKQSRDAKIFKKTANRTRRQNRPKMISRGGTRL